MGETPENRQEKNWLIKSSTRILGPHSIEEIAQLLLKKHISIIDEVRQPQGRWKYIREHEVFNETVDALRAEQESAPELTQTQTMTQTMTQTLTSHSMMTKTDLITDDETVTPTPPSVLRSDLRPPPPGAGSIKEVTPLREQTLPQKQGTSSVSYGLEDDAQVQRQVTRTQKNVRWILFGLVILVVLGIFGLQFRKSLKKNEGYEILIQQALRYRSLQLYDKALDAYKKAALIKEPSPEIQSEMAPVLIVLDRQNVGGRRILEKVIQESSGNRARVIDASLGVAMSYVLEGSLREAEDTLQKILVMEPGNFNARLNLGLIAIRKGDWREADRQLEELSRRHSPHPLVLLGRGVTLLESSVTGINETRAASLASEIQSFLQSSSQLRQELLMILAALQSYDLRAYQLAMRDFLLEISMQSKAFAQDLRLDWRIANWEFLERQCRRFVDRVAVSSWTKAMRAVCMAEAGRESDARAALNEALAIGRRDPVVLFTQANLLYRSGLRNEAFAVLRVPELSNVPMAEVLLGRICLEQGDITCAERAFQNVSQRKRNSLLVIAGLADIALRQGNRARAHQLVQDGLAIESSYLPLIELKESMVGGNP